MRKRKAEIRGETMMTDYQCEKCGEPLETFEEDGILVIPPCNTCVRMKNNTEIVEPALPEKGEE